MEMKLAQFLRSPRYSDRSNFRLFKSRDDGTAGYVSQTVCIAGCDVRRAVCSWEQIPLTPSRSRSPTAGLLGGYGISIIRFHRLTDRKNNYAMESAMEIIRLLVVLTPIALSDVPEIHQDFEEATVFVLVTIFDQFIEIRGC
jgi:hypothetical protein